MQRTANNSVAKYVGSARTYKSAPRALRDGNPFQTENSSSDEKSSDMVLASKEFPVSNLSQILSIFLSETKELEGNFSLLLCVILC